jgi:hypothetical protein
MILVAPVREASRGELNRKIDAFPLRDGDQRFVVERIARHQRHEPWRWKWRRHLRLANGIYIAFIYLFGGVAPDVAGDTLPVPPRSFDGDCLSVL